MKCYHTYDKEGNKHFIPMCWGTVHSKDPDDCICSDPLTEHYFEKKRFNEVVQEKNETIKNLQSEVDHLRSLIEEFAK